MKPQSLAEYDSDVTRDCERVLVTLLSGLGPWKESVFLIGGLAPRYLVKARPPDAPPHAGTGDVDIVIDLAILADTEAYQTLEDNLKRMGFERAENNQGKLVNWRWKTRTEHGAVVILEFLADDPNLLGGALQELPTKGAVSAINIPHAAMVFDLHEKVEVTADLLSGGGRATETVAHANRVSYGCLKAFAFEHRREGKDAHDLTHCLEHAEGGIEASIAQFQDALKGAHEGAIGEALRLLARHFTDPKPDEAYLRNGPVAVARFEIPGDPADPEIREQQALRQRQVADLMGKFLAGVERD